MFRDMSEEDEEDEEEDDDDERAGGAEQPPMVAPEVERKRFAQWARELEQRRREQLYVPA